MTESRPFLGRVELSERARVRDRDGNVGSKTDSVFVGLSPFEGLTMSDPQQLPLKRCSFKFHLAQTLRDPKDLKQDGKKLQIHSLDYITLDKAQHFLRKRCYVYISVHKVAKMHFNFQKQL